MRLLVLGGTGFVSQAVATEAVAHGHEVACACRGRSGALPDGVRHVAYDRSADRAPTAEVGDVDAVLEVARRPSWARSALQAWPHAHRLLVSTVNVYPDDMVPGGRPATTPLREPEDVDPAASTEAYGRMKVACEQLVTDGTVSASVVRPGLIAGPGDPSGRFGYWAERLAAADPGEPVLAGGTPSDLVQVLDVRDLAAWLVDLAEQRHAGTWDAVGPATPIGDLLAEVSVAVGTRPELAWLPDHTLSDLGVGPWSGEGSLPLWLPRPAYDGMMTRDHAPAAAAGLRTRPVAETARDTLAWLRATPDAARTGLDRDREREVLRHSSAAR